MNIKILGIDVDGKAYIGNYLDTTERHFVAKCGNVISFVYRNRPRILTKQTTWDGYYRVKIDGKYELLHRLIARVFLGDPPDNSFQVNHKDHDKKNNSIENLEWVTQVENLHHCMKAGRHNMGMTPVVATCMETGSRIFFESQTQAKDCGFTQANISKCIKGERNHVNKFKWSYDEY